MRIGWMPGTQLVDLLQVLFSYCDLMIVKRSSESKMYAVQGSS